MPTTSYFFGTYSSGISASSASSRNLSPPSSDSSLSTVYISSGTAWYATMYPFHSVSPRSSCKPALVSLKPAQEVKPSMASLLGAKKVSVSFLASSASRTTGRSEMASESSVRSGCESMISSMVMQSVGSSPFSTTSSRASWRRPLPRTPGRKRLTPELPPEYRRRPRAFLSLPAALRWGDTG